MRAYGHAHVAVAATNSLETWLLPARTSGLSFRRCDVAVFGLGEEFARFQKYTLVICTVVIASILHVIPFA